MDRYTYDLSHYSLVAGQMGRLQTIGVIPVVAGDSFELNIEGIVRLSPLRRPLVVDARVDTFAFFVPYRHIYGQDWIDFIKEGIDEAETFTGVSTAVAGLATCNLFGTPNATTLPLWQVAGYNRIWNRYFRHPTVTAELADNAVPSTSAERFYGRLVAHLKTFPTTGISYSLDATDRAVAVDDTSDTFDLVDLEVAKGRYRTQVEREWFAHRYNDVLEEVFGTSVNIDADERPEMLMRDISWMGSFDIDGTADANFGQVVGKSSAVVNLRFPRRYFDEHGTLWIMSCLRWPPIFRDELHYLMSAQHVNPSYAEISGDPAVVGVEDPHEIQLRDIFDTTSTTAIGTHPYGQWYRTHPHYVHDNFWSVNSGFPVLTTPSSHEAALYANPELGWSQAFSSIQLGHWHGAYKVNLLAQRIVPGPKSSMFAGT